MRRHVGAGIGAGHGATRAISLDGAGGRSGVRGPIRHIAGVFAVSVVCAGRDALSGPLPWPYPGPYAAPTPGAPFDPAAGGQPPIAAFNGTIQTPPPNWDPYATPPPGSSAILPQGPYIDWGHPMATMAKMQRFIQAVRVDYHYFAPEGSNPLGFNEIELNTTLAIPFSAERKRRC